jgi:hypothetical protein
MLLPAHQLQRLNQIPVDQPSAAERAAALQPTDPGNLDTLEAHTPVEGESHAQPEHYVTSLPPVKCKRRYDPRPDNDPGDPEALPQEWTFLEDLQLRIRQLETDHRPLPSLYQKDIPRNVQRLAMEAYISALDNLDAMEPKTYKAACEGPHADDWKAAMDDEFQSLRENETWELVNESTVTNLLSGKWVYRLKRGADGRITRYKARWVVRGFEQEYGIDYNETFASVVRQKTYRSLFALAAIHDWEIEQMDVKTAFLYGPVNETIFVQLPPGYQQPGKACKLRKALYGLKQAPRVWFQTLSKALAEFGFRRSQFDEAVFYKDNMILAVYVDDILIFGPQKTKIDEVKKQLNQKFKMTDLGPCEYFLGTKVTRDRAQKKIWLSQTAYLERTLQNLGLTNLTPQNIPMEPGETLEPAPADFEANAEDRQWYQSVIRSLMFAMIGTRPDLAYPISKLSRFMTNPTKEHRAAAIRVLKYVKKTLKLGLLFDGNLNQLIGYSDAGWARDRSYSKSIECYIFKLAGAAISWKSRKQSVISTSSCEAEYTAIFSASLEAVYLGGLLQEFGFPEGPVTIKTDNSGATSLAKDPKHHERTKHIRVRFHKIRELTEHGVTKVEWTPRTENPADLGTKALPRPELEKWRTEIGLVECH